MDNNEVLDHLLKIESEAAALVTDAQAEADNRITEAEKQNRAAFDKRFREENERLEKGFLQSKELARQQYQKELETYKDKISSVNVNNDRFSNLLDSLVLGEG
jgi:vacuolar-type H+-ATPase subunit H